MFYSDRITSVHLDVTDKCNASCPMCPRTINGGPANPHLTNQEMTLEDAKKIFNIKFLQQLHFIQLCGNFGDPMVAKEVLDILEYFREVNPSISLGFHSNASGRNPEWWQRLGKILSQPGDFCKFGIDGLEDTNAIYRRNTRWPKVMSAAENFIQAGGVAHWEFLVFKHNEHQIEEARAKAKAMGFHHFFVKKTSRFFDYSTGENKPFPIFSKAGETVDYLYPPEAKELINPVSNFVENSLSQNKEVLEESVVEHESETSNIVEHVEEAKVISEVSDNSVQIEDESVPRHREIEKYVLNSKIDCFAAKEKSVFIRWDGEVYPCCFIGGRVDRFDRGIDGEKLDKMLLDTVGSRSSISAKYDSVENIVNGTWFSSIADSWIDNTPECKKIETCSQMCGVDVGLVMGEYD